MNHLERINKMLEAVAEYNEGFCSQAELEAVIAKHLVAMTNTTTFDNAYELVARLGVLVGSPKLFAAHVMQEMFLRTDGYVSDLAFHRGFELVRINNILDNKRIDGETKAKRLNDAIREWSDIKRKIIKEAM